MDPARSMSAPGSLAIGSRLGRYQIIRRIAMGGMAELYLARQTGDAGYEKVVALKRVLPHLAEDETFVQMFLNEARIAAGLDHSNIVHVVDFGSEGGEHFMVMEYVHGRSVLDLLRGCAQYGGLSLSCALTIVTEVAAALHYAHERAGTDGRPLGLVHRDVSPSNVLVSFEGDVKLVDFGIAKATAHTRVTRSGAIKGKLGYMAPEQVRGETLDRRADVFALSVVMYELCTGRRCFVAPGEFALINRVAAARYERPTSIDPEFPKALERIIARGLAPAPHGRWPNARELQLAVEQFAVDHAHRLSKVALSETMHRVFGDEAYPTTSTLPPLEIATEPSGPTTVVSPRRPTPLMLAIGALALGVGLGVGLPRLFDASAPTPGEPERAAPTAEPAAGIALDDDRPIVIDAPQRDLGGPAAPEPATEPELPAIAPGVDRPTAKKKRPRKKTIKSGSTDKPAKSTHEYLPPSRRGG